MIITVWVPEVGQYRSTDTEHPWRSCWSTEAEQAASDAKNHDAINRELFGVDTE